MCCLSQQGGILDVFTMHNAKSCACCCAGELIFYDFGMMSELMPTTKEKLLELFYAVYKKDASAVLTGLQDLGILVAKDPLPIRRTIQYFLENIERQVWLKMHPYHVQFDILIFTLYIYIYIIYDIAGEHQPPSVLPEGQAKAQVWPILHNGAK